MLELTPQSIARDLRSLKLRCLRKGGYIVPSPCCRAIASSGPAIHSRFVYTILKKKKERGKAAPAIAWPTAPDR
jgi:hypothetical protein